MSFLSGSIEEEEIEEEGEEGGGQSADDKIKAEQAKLEEDKKALQDNHTMMAEVCAGLILSRSVECGRHFSGATCMHKHLVTFSNEFSGSQ